MCMIIDLLTNNSNNESLAFGCSGFAADLYFVDSGVNGPDITDNEISILMTSSSLFLNLSSVTLHAISSSVMVHSLIWV